MANKCEVCTEKCPQAERAHQAALGRLYATKELVALLKKVESGELVEVVRCKDCKHFSPKSGYTHIDGFCYVGNTVLARIAEGYCNRGERREGE